MSLEGSFQSKQGNWKTIKNEKAQNQEKLNNFNSVFQKEQQRKFQKVKDTQVRAKLYFQTMSNFKKNDLKNRYEQKCQEKKDNAKKTKLLITQSLEVEEAKLLRKLQQTQ